jgi:uncharacterized protein involved in type VI secretion and phage assembly
MPVCGKHRGVVVNNVDPQQIGRLQVTVPDVPEAQNVFAMPSTPYAGPGVGFYFIPPIGANVWVDFEDCDPNRPVWSGCFWSAGEAPTQGLATVVEKKILKTENVTLTLDDLPGGGFTMETGGAKITLTQGIITIEDGLGAIIRLTGPSVDINNGGLVVT